MKFILLCILFLIITGIAFINLFYYKSRKNFIKQLIDFLKKYELDMNFNKISLRKYVLLNTNIMSRDIYKLLQNPINFDNYPKYVNNIEKNEFCNFFKNLGFLDLYGESDKVNSFIKKLENDMIAYDDDLKQKGFLRSKLIFIFGIMILIILL